jgi:hypothetical protein
MLKLRQRFSEIAFVLDLEYGLGTRSSRELLPDNIVPVE